MGADLFAGTAAYYARYRPGYPPLLLDDLAAATRLDGTGRLLDVGCGTGQLAIPLARWFEQVVGLDVSGEMLAEAERQTALAGVTTIKWLELAGEAISPALGRFRLVTIGSALHWMRRDEVLARCRAVLAPGGALAIFNSGGSFWNGTLAWQQAVVAVVQRWLGPERRAGQGTFAADPLEPYTTTLARAGFAGITTTERRIRHTWTVATITGLLYASSYCRRDYLGDRAPAFEADLARTLLALEPADRFEQEIVFGYQLGWHG